MIKNCINSWYIRT